MTANRNTLDWSISGREALYTGGLPETNTFSALTPVLKGRFGGASAFITLVTIVCFGVTGRDGVITENLVCTRPALPEWLMEATLR